MHVTAEVRRMGGGGTGREGLRLEETTIDEPPQCHLDRCGQTGGEEIGRQFRERQRQSLIGAARGEEYVTSRIV